MYLIEFMNKTKRKQVFKGLRKGSVTYNVFSTLVSLMKKTGQEVKDYLDFCYWFDPVALRQNFYGSYRSKIEDSTPSGKELEEQNIRRALKKLESLNYIKIEENNKIGLTRKGGLEFIKYSIDTQREKTKWDGKWRIVIFDILEHKRNLRNILRNRLRWLGFKELQKSVWVFPYDVSRELREALKICNISVIGDVRFLTVEKIDEDNDLKEKFGMK